MPSRRSRGGSEDSGSGINVARAGVAAAALSGVASVASAEGAGALFDPADVGIDDAEAFAIVDVAAMREHGDLVELGADDVGSAWATEGTASVEEMVDDLENQLGASVGKARTVAIESDIQLSDVDRAAAVGATDLSDDDRVGGIVLEGSFEGADVVGALDQVTDVDTSGDYTTLTAADDVTVNVTDGQLVAGGAGRIDESSEGVIDRLTSDDGISFSDGALDQLDGMDAVAGVQWGRPEASDDLVPDHVEGWMEARDVWPDGVSVSDLTSNVTAVAAGVDAADRRGKAVVEFDGDVPTAHVEDIAAAVGDKYSSHIEDVEGEGSISEADGLLVFEGTTTDAQISDAQSAAQTRFVDETTGLRDGVVWSVVPTLRAGYRFAQSYARAFLDKHA